MGSQNDPGHHTILVAEDFDDARAMMKALLEIEGYEVLEAENGLVALDVAVREHPDLILMDLRMPVLDGVEATRRISAWQATRDVPIVAISAHCDNGWREAVLAAGARECIPKPVNLDDLDRVLETYLSSAA